MSINIVFGAAFFLNLMAVITIGGQKVVTIYTHEIVDLPDAEVMTVGAGLIEFKDVNFNYKDQKSLFNNLSITLNPGEKIGLVGYSGGGKSTFIKLILRLIEVQSALY